MESNIFLKKFAYSQVFLTKKSKIFKINSLARQQANCHSSQFDALLERCYLSNWKRAALRRSLSTGFNWFSIGNFHLFIGSPNHFRLLKSIRLGRLFSGLIAIRWSTHRPVTFDVQSEESLFWRKPGDQRIERDKRTILVPVIFIEELSIRGSRSIEGKNFEVKFGEILEANIPTESVVLIQ